MWTRVTNAVIFNRKGRIFNRNYHLSGGLRVPSAEKTAPSSSYSLLSSSLEAQAIINLSDASLEIKLRWGLLAHSLLLFFFFIFLVRLLQVVVLVVVRGLALGVPRTNAATTSNPKSCRRKIKLLRRFRTAPDPRPHERSSPALRRRASRAKVARNPSEVTS